MAFIRSLLLIIVSRGAYAWIHRTGHTDIRRGDKYRRFAWTEEMGLVGKRVLVTGASGGIGAAIAVALGSRGCRLLLHYNCREVGVRETARRVEEAGGTVDGVVRLDFRSGVDKIWQIVDEVWPIGLDTLINNAGVVTKRAASIASCDDFEATLAINTVAPYRLACGAKERGVSDVIMISSIHATQSVEWMSAYAASKAALDSITKTLAIEWAQANVRVNAIAPGIVPVERTAEMLNSPEAQTLWQSHLPLRSMGTVEQIADACIWLLDSPASQWMTGTAITLDGGMLARANMPIRPRPAENDLPHVIPAASNATLLDDIRGNVLYSSPKLKPVQAAPTLTLREARAAAHTASTKFGASSSQAANAWALVDDLERKSEQTLAPSLVEECDLDDTTDRCRKLAKDLEELDALIAAGPGESSLREAARRMLREIEASYDNRPFSSDSDNPSS
mmetsp:Transcript_20603/g.31493  ORF Transcript_20603/g.31493 Transcript_20603/m.31493 type:complete len:450 (+) Transcript_20603:39-1388(+)